MSFPSPIHIDAWKRQHNIYVHAVSTNLVMLKGGLLLQISHSLEIALKVFVK